MFLYSNDQHVSRSEERIKTAETIDVDHEDCVFSVPDKAFKGESKALVMSVRALQTKASDSQASSSATANLLALDVLSNLHLTVYTS